MTTTFLPGVILLLCSVVGSSWICTHGEKLHTSKEGYDNCIMCPDGTWNRQCYNCTRIENPTSEVEITKFNGIHDAVIDCECGYYRYMPRTKDEKQECRKCQDCHVPVEITGYYRNTSSYQSSGPESTTLLGVPEDAENRTRGTSVSNDTIHSHEQNKTNQSQNEATERQTSVPADLYVYVVLPVALILISISNFVTFVRTDEPATNHSLISGSCSRFTTPRIMTGFLVLLIILLLICVLLKTGAIAASHDASMTFVVLTVSAAVIYVIAANFLTTRQKKRQVNEVRPPPTVKYGELETMVDRRTDKLVQIQKD